jgi:rod shape-determining protein MreC
VRIRRLALLGSILAVCLVLLTLQTRGRASQAADAVALLTTPVQTTLAAVHRGAFGIWSTYVAWKDVRSQNRILREENQRLKVEALAVSETETENRRLRRLLELKARLPMATVTGEVIAREWGGWVRSLTINKGEADHVQKLTAVISPDGLVGRVVDVRPGAAIVQILTDPASTVGAHALRSRAPGVVEGDPRGTLRFKYMARDGAGLEIGDLVVSSGLGGLFPRGLPIGHVRSIDDRGSALFHYAVLDPVVDLSRLYEVLLVTGDRRHDVAALFPSGR